MNALKNIALSPAEFHNLKHEYTKADGSKLMIIDTTDYKYGACTGRVVEHWHSGSMTTRVPELSRAVPGAYVELNEILAKKLGIKNGDSVIVESPRCGLNSLQSCLMFQRQQADRDMTMCSSRGLMSTSSST